MTVRLLTFDLDDTLWPVGPVIQRAEHRMRDLLDRVAPEINRHFDREALAGLREEIVAATPDVVHDLSHMRRRIIALAAERAGCPEPERIAEEAFTAFMDARHDIEYFEDALDTLAHLANHYTLGALSNGNASVERLGLDRYFSFHLNAASVGRSKPAPDMFEAALVEAGVGADAAVHIGDHPRDDVRGAAAVGMRTVWVNRPGVRWEHEDVRPDWEIGELTELARLFPG